MRWNFIPFYGWLVSFPFLFVCVWICTLITTFLLSLSSLQALPHTPHCSCSNLWCLFFICYSIHICICIYIKIPTYNLLSLYNATCMYIFRANHLALNNQFVWPWGGLPLLVVSFLFCKCTFFNFQFIVYIFLRLWLMVLEHFYIHISMNVLLTFSLG